MTEPGLVIWTIYSHPADYPDGFVVRPWSIDSGISCGPAYGAPSLAAARLSLPPGLTRFPAEPSDDPVIVESWV